MIDNGKKQRNTECGRYLCICDINVSIGSASTWAENMGCIGSLLTSISLALRLLSVEALGLLFKYCE